MNSVNSVIEIVIRSRSMCDVCGTVFYGKHFHFEKYNLCSLVCMQVMREHVLQAQAECEKNKAGVVAYFHDYPGSEY